MVGRLIAWLPGANKEGRLSSVQSLSHVQLFVTPWAAARQASLSITNSRSLLKLMSIEWVMPSNHLILCHPLLLSSIFPSTRVFSNESVLRIRWPKYWSFSFSISPSSEYSGLIFFRMDWLDLLAVQGTLKSLLHLDNKTSQSASAGSELEPGVGRVLRARLSRLRRGTECSLGVCPGGGCHSCKPRHPLPALVQGMRPARCDLHAVTLPHAVCFQLHPPVHSSGFSCCLPSVLSGLPVK